MLNIQSVIVVLLMIVSSTLPALSNAATLSCSPLAEDQCSLDPHGTYEGSAGIQKSYLAHCGNYMLSLSGYGLNLEGEAAAVSGVMLQCPFQSELEGTYYGLSAKASVFLGLEVGGFAGTNGVCYLLGGTLVGLGASINGLKLKITKY